MLLDGDKEAENSSYFRLASASHSPDHRLLAWAVDDNGRPLLPVGRGFAGERQRELAYRFGVNLVMHVLTGNYKSDQVHVPALLDRLGQ